MRRKYTTFPKMMADNAWTKFTSTDCLDTDYLDTDGPRLSCFAGLYQGLPSSVEAFNGIAEAMP
jgi:hypothetical protein